jgi:hypothetical protein
VPRDADALEYIVERYTDGVELFEGLVQGLRFDILKGKPAFRVGVRQDERADITIKITAAAARELNSLYNADPNYHTGRAKFLSTGERGPKAIPREW